MPEANLVWKTGLLQGGKQDPGLATPGPDLPYGALEWPLRHPSETAANAARDRDFTRNFFHFGK